MTWVRDKFVPSVVKFHTRTDMHFYPKAGHAFHRASTPRHNAEAAKGAWDKTVSFISQFSPYPCLDLQNWVSLSYCSFYSGSRFPAREIFFLRPCEGINFHSHAFEFQAGDLLVLRPRNLVDIWFQVLPLLCKS